MDNSNRKILEILQDNGSITNSELANQVGLSPATTLERVRKLENSGVIAKRVALLNPKKIGKGTIAFVLVSMATHSAESIRQFPNDVQKLTDVLECYHVAGEQDYLLKVIVADMQQYEDFLINKLTNVPNLGKVQTWFVISTVKYQTGIALNEPQRKEDS